jgi:hypothetical protein
VRVSTRTVEKLEKGLAVLPIFFNHVCRLLQISVLHVKDMYDELCQVSGSTTPRLCEASDDGNPIPTEISENL